MRFSQFFIPTTKEVPRDAVLKSHQYLIRGGYIYQVGSGIYSFLPLGKRVLDKISKVIKEEMDSSGAIEVMMGFITPSDLWKQTGRYSKYGKELLRFKDRKENEFVLGPTYEESVTDLVKQFVRSYKDLPLNLYQIHLKFRDEMRPRFGLMRGREFIMKDAYSFHSTQEDLDREFDLMNETYQRIFKRLGLDFRVVDADSGAIGGSGSKEFMVLADCGEDTIAMCNQCSYASNIEAAKRQKRITQEYAPKAEFSKFTTPNISSIKDLSAFFKVDPFYILKAVVKKIVFLPESKKDPELAFFFLRGDDELEETKALNILNNYGAQALELLDASVEDIRSAGLFEGFIGPYALGNITESKFIFFDEDLREERDLICGANEKDKHFVGVDLSTFDALRYEDLAKVKEGDLCPCCDGRIEYKKGIEVGHIFKLKDRYSKDMGANFLDQNGKSQPFIMGCYGIGVSRLLAAILEQKSDEFGCVWGLSSAPFEVNIVLSNTKDSQQLDFANKLYEKMKQNQLEVLLDDRNERFGFKMKDFELIGSSFGIIIGKELEKNQVEVVVRDGMQKQILKADVEEIIAFIKGRLS
ncbi:MULTISPECIES: proline--tRNA ligase [unclassified Helicobacter]|uniref:proline--tRNA ligase n=1 Tax=unclassified Helicobacter TaxID=2593540 RepID=UPI000CF0D58C|nr:MULTISPECIES: proline--tRNA ligase [unclassified Helicobacter]